MITGFVNAAALLIIVSQLPAITGIGIDQTSSPVLQISALLQSIDEMNATTLAMGAAALVFLLYSKTLLQRLLNRMRGDDQPLAKTGPLWIVLLGMLVVSTLGLSDTTETVGPVPAGLPELKWPSMNLALWLALLPSAAVIAVITYIESYSIGATLAAGVDPTKN